jgi:hypothetical protein
MSQVLTDDEGNKFIADPEHVLSRRWPCCKDPLLVGREDGVPLVAICDKKAGHAGQHRGRLRGTTYIWRTLSDKETAKRRELQREALEKHAARLVATPSDADPGDAQPAP